MNRVNHFLGVIAAAALMACEQPVAEDAPESGNTSSGAGVSVVIHPKFHNDCANWDTASIKVSTFTDHWTLASFGKKGCSDKPHFEQRYELDSQFVGMWGESLLVEVGTADADRELYLLDPYSGDRIGELWYVGEPVFSERTITYFEPTRERAKLNQCPQPLGDLKMWQDQGAVIMYSNQKEFDRNSGSTSELKVRGCYAMR